MARTYDIGLLLVLAFFVVAPFTSMVPLVTYDEKETTMPLNFTKEGPNGTEISTFDALDLNSACQRLTMKENNGTTITCSNMIWKLAGHDSTVDANGAAVSITFDDFERIRVGIEYDISADCRRVCAVGNDKVVYEGTIGIFDASRTCQVFKDTSVGQEEIKEKVPCHKDKALEDELVDLDNVMLGDIGMFTCAWAENFAGSPGCAGTRNGWCRSNQGVGFAMMLVIVLFVLGYVVMACKKSPMDFDSKYVSGTVGIIYLFTGASMLFIAERARYFATSEPSDCGFDQPIITFAKNNVTEIHASGYSELGAGAYLMYIGFFFCVMRLIMMVLENNNPNFKPRLLVWVYLTLVALAILVITLPFVTIIVPNAGYGGLTITSFKPYGNNGPNAMFGDYMDGTCTPTAFDAEDSPYKSCKSTYESFCHETKVAAPALISLAGVGLIIAIAAAMRPMDKFKEVNIAMFSIIALWSAVHAIYTTYMVWHPLEIDAEGDVSCGFNWAEGSDYGGMSLAATWIMFVISVIFVAITATATVDNGGYSAVDGMVTF